MSIKKTESDIIFEIHSLEIQLRKVENDISELNNNMQKGMLVGLEINNKLLKRENIKGQLKYAKSLID